MARNWSFPRRREILTVLIEQFELKEEKERDGESWIRDRYKA